MAKQSTPETKPGADPGQDREKADAAEKDTPPEGPHAREDLIDRNKTPGTGALSDGQTEGEVDAGTG